MLFTALLLAATGNVLAYTVSIQGIITDGNGNPVPRHKVELSTLSTGSTSGYSSTLYTDANGIFEDKFDVDTGLRGILQLVTESCKDNLIKRHYPFTERNNHIKADIRYCTPAAEKCKVQIRRTKLNTGTGIVLIAHAKGTGPFKYLWSTGETTQRIKAGASGEYCVTVVDATGCEARACIKLITDRAPDCRVTIHPERTPNGFVLTAVASGAPPFKFHWNTGETTQRILVTQSGEYCVKVEDSKGCVASHCFKLTSDQGGRDCSVKISQSRSITGDIVLTAHAKGHPPFQYEWNTGETTPRILVTMEGEYCVVIKDSTGCIARACIKVRTDQGGRDCDVKITLERDSTTLAGVILKAHARGTAPFKYEWTTGDTTPTIRVTREGEYCVKIEDRTGCVAKACFKYTTVIDTSDKCRVKITLEKDSTVRGGVILTAHSGGKAPYVYKWSTGDSTQSIRVIREGLYCVIVIDSTGCVARACIRYPQDVDSTNCSVKISLDRTAAGLVLVANARGADPIQYHWNTGDSTRRIKVLRPGEYCVKIIDSTGCIASDCFKVPSDSGATRCQVVISIKRSPNDTNVVVLSAESKGHAPFTYEWSTGETTQSVRVRNRGVYCVVVTDSAGCQAKYCITLPSGKGRGGVIPGQEPTAIKLYPNPIHSTLNVSVETSLDYDAQYRIVNAYGRTMLTGNCPQSTREFELDLGFLPTGTYTLVLVGPQSVVSRTFYKQ